jgi:tetratricopeptide (TPR) repeat protein
MKKQPPAILKYPRRLAQRFEYGENSENKLLLLRRRVKRMFDTPLHRWATPVLICGNFACVTLLWALPRAMPNRNINLASNFFLNLALVSFLLLPLSAKSASLDQTNAPQGTESVEAHLGKAYEAMRSERYADAAREFRAALELDPTLVMRARFPLAVSLFEQRNYPEARAEFEKVRGDAGDQPGIYYYLGRIDQEQQNYKGATENLSKAAAKPPYPDTAFYLGTAYLKAGDEVNAERWLKEATRLDSNDSRAFYQLATLYRKQGRTEEANQAFARTKEEKASSDKLTQLKVQCDQELNHGLTEQARSVCEKLNDPDNADKLLALGVLYGQHGFLQDALAPLKRAAEISPRSLQVQYNLAYTYFQLGRYSDARAPLERAVQRWPDLFPLRSLYGNVLWKLGDTSGAYKELSYANKLNPQEKSTQELLYQATVILADQAEAKPAANDAIRYWKEAANLRPAQPEPHYHLSQLYAKTGRAQLAKQEQQEADRLTNLQAP